MIFHVGQRVKCVDASEPPNPWHKQHPLTKGKIYRVHAIGRPPPGDNIDIDGSGRLWENSRFRPLEDDGMATLMAALKRTPTKARKHA